MPADDIIGTTLDDRYRIVDVIGVGGMGTVYAAEHLMLGRLVAVKMLRDEFMGDAGLRARFMAEARAMAEIRHDHIVSVMDIGAAPGGSLYFVMEHLSGEDLADTLIREGKLPWLRVRSIGLQLCLGLAACHAKKVIHRDLKPPNCFMVERVDGSDYVKILDFGIAKMLAAEGRRMTEPHGLHRVDSRRWQHTTTGEVFGTMAYMSPEHFFGEPVDHRTDIYALGVILYEMLTGKTPLAADNIGNFAEELRYLDPTPPSKVAPGAGIPADVDYLVLRALAKKPEERFASMHELGVALAEAREDRPVLPLRPPQPLTGGDSGKATMVWSRPEAQAALAGLLGRRAPGRRVWSGIAGGMAVAAALGWWTWTTRAREPDAVAAPPAATPGALHEPVIAAPMVRMVAPPAAVVRAAPSTEVVARSAAPRCPPLTNAEWDRLFAPLADKVEHCRVTEAVKSTVAVALAIGVSDGQWTTRPLPQQSGKVLAAVRCIRKHVGARVKLPARLLGCRMAPMVRYF
jgi:tRNA A-37 threonylcarbamoyl transferase component Bud32